MEKRRLGKEAYSTCECLSGRLLILEGRLLSVGRVCSGDFS